jgi:hypothetical protein
LSSAGHNPAHDFLAARRSRFIERGGAEARASAVALHTPARQKLSRGQAQRKHFQAIEVSVATRRAARYNERESDEAHRNSARSGRKKISAKVKF